MNDGKGQTKRLHDYPRPFQRSHFFSKVSRNYGFGGVSIYVSVDLQRQIRAYFADCCAYCRTLEVLTVSTFEFDHIIPRSAGGQTTFENLCLSCPSCNRHKAQRQSAIDPITNETVALFHPYRQEWEEHFDCSADRTEILGLSPTGRATISAPKMNRPQLVRVRRMWVKMGEHPPKLGQ